jgi:hypothetical protein
LFIITSLSIEVQPDFRHTPRDKNPTENTDCTQNTSSLLGIWGGSGQGKEIRIACEITRKDL